MWVPSGDDDTTAAGAEPGRRVDCPEVSVVTIPSRVACAMWVPSGKYAGWRRQQFPHPNGQKEAVFLFSIRGADVNPVG